MVENSKYLKSIQRKLILIPLTLSPQVPSLGLTYVALVCVVQRCSNHIKSYSYSIPFLPLFCLYRAERILQI